MEKFDPYHQWLGIPASEQPPHHYRLLGIPPFEESPTVIENAANQRMAHLRTFQTGKHAAESQRLLNEVAAARVCLLKAEKKTAYDQLLRQQISGPAGDFEADSLEPGLAAVFQTGIPSSSGISSMGRGKKSRPKPTALIVAGALTVVAVGVAVWVTIRHDGVPSDTGLAKAGDSATSPTPTKDALPKLPQPLKKETPIPATTGPKEEPKSADLKSEIPNSAPEAAARPKPQPQEDKGAKPASQDSPVAKVEPGEPQAPAKELVPPAANEQKRLIAEIDEIYKPADAKDQAAKAALARKLLEEGRKNETNRAEQFVLLRRAGEIAREAGEADLMLEAVDAIADAGFDIRPLAVKSLFMKRLVEQGASGGAAQHSTICTACVKFAEEAAAKGGVNVALEVLDAANKSLAKSLMQAQAAQRAAKAALARARTPADKAEREKKAEEAQVGFEAIKSTQSSVAECAKGLQQARHEHAAILAAQERLKTSPDDPEACLAVGRWFCFQQGDWDEGLKLLAKGSDEVLKSLAANDLALKPAKAADKVARGDAWWDLAEKATGKAKAGMRRRAGHWYQAALPELAPGLAKLKIEKRLAQAGDEPASKTDKASSRLRPPLAVAPFDDKAARRHQAAWAKHLRVRPELTNSIKMKFVLIPPGEFDMGSAKEVIEEESRLHGDNGWYSEHLANEPPRHRVRITKPFWLGVTDVTQEEYERVMGSNPSKFQGDPRRPVEQVSWSGAVEFCRKVSELPAEKAAERRYQLPSEAQWEYACRAGSQTKWYFGNDEARLTNNGWFDRNAGGTTHPVGQLNANPWGLYDMYGNVYQWCQDWYATGYYATSPADDPTGPAGGSDRVRRGGGYFHLAMCCRSAFRDHFGAGDRGGHVGFRVCQVPAEKPDK